MTSVFGAAMAVTGIHADIRRSAIHAGGTGRARARHPAAVA
jgi:hypothetical protein